MLVASWVAGCIPAPQLRPRDGGDEREGVVDASVMDAAIPDAPVDDTGGNASSDLPPQDLGAPDSGSMDVVSDLQRTDAETSDSLAIDAQCGDAGVSCSGVCVDLARDPMHCGRCGAECGAGVNERADCRAGVCEITCAPDFHRCDALCLDSRVVTSCGDRCSPCPSTANGESICTAGRCGVRCDPGFLVVAGRCEPPAAPRPLAPPAGSVLGGRSPTLEWELPTGAEGAEVEICEDRACTRSVRRIISGGSTTTIAPPLDRGVWFWRLRSRAAGVASGPQSVVWSFHIVGAASRSTHWGSTPDFDGDGLPELVTAAISVSGGAGRLYRFTPAHLATGVADSTVSTTAVGFAQLGFSMTASDVNGDGFADLVASAPNQGMDSGGVYVFNGTATGPSPTATSISHTTPGELFGWSVSSAGDFNGDGYGDVIVGAPQWASGRGRAYLFLGSTGGLATAPSVTLDPAEGPGSQCAFSVAGIGDVNGDGLSDLAIGCPYANGGAGSVHVYRGIRSGTPVNSRLTVTGSVLAGFHVAGVGDVDGDGVPDIGVGAPGTSPAGRAYVLRGATGTGDPTLVATITNPVPGVPLFGARISGAYDFNGDGVCDVAVSAPGSGETTGRAHVYSGLALTNAPIVTYQSAEAPGSAFGFPAELLGDMTGDGLSELAIGEYDAELPTAGTTPRQGRGRIHIARGGAAPSSAPTWTIRGLDSAPARFGFSVAR